jgi:predicted Rossmann fold nucleotide-binding protein DprA/Smf involved in DNA uptake
MTDEEISKMMQANTKLISQNAELVSQNAKLERKLAALKADPEQQMENPLEKEKWKILQYFFDTAENLTAGNIGSNFGIKTNVVQFHLDGLIAAGFIEERQNIRELRTTGNKIGNIITPAGRDAIIGRTGRL